MTSSVPARADQPLPPLVTQAGPLTPTRPARSAQRSVELTKDDRWTAESWPVACTEPMTTPFPPWPAICGLVSRQWWSNGPFWTARSLSVGQIRSATSLAFRPPPPLYSMSLLKQIKGGTMRPPCQLRTNAPTRRTIFHDKSFNTTPISGRCTPCNLFIPQLLNWD